MSLAYMDEDVDLAAPAVAPLTLTDRCDAPAVGGGPNGRPGRGACGAQSFIRAVLPSGNDLIFCAHHGREHEAALAAAGASIHEGTGTITGQPPCRSVSRSGEVSRTPALGVSEPELATELR